MIFSSVVYGHPVKYSYKIPHEFLSGLIARRCNIFGQFYLGKSYFFTLFRSNFCQSITRVTSSKQLFLQSSCFFEELLFSEQSLFLSIFFSEQLLLQSETSTDKSHLKNRNFFSAVNLSEQLPTEYIYRRATFSKQIFLRSINFFKKSEKQYSTLPTFS